MSLMGCGESKLLEPFWASGMLVQMEVYSLLYRMSRNSSLTYWLFDTFLSHLLLIVFLVIIFRYNVVEKIGSQQGLGVRSRIIWPTPIKKNE